MGLVCKEASSSPDGEVDLIALGVGKRPPVGGVRVVDHVPARGEGGCDTRLHLVARHVEVDMDAVPLRPWGIHLLEREGRPDATGVEHVFVPDRLIGEHRGPEPLQLGNGERIDIDLHVLHARWVSRQAELAGALRDLPGQLDVLVAQSTWLRCEQPDRHALRSQVHIDVVVGGMGEVADRPDQRGAGGEGPSPEVGGGEAAAPESPPVFDAEDSSNCLPVIPSVIPTTFPKSRSEDITRCLAPPSRTANRSDSWGRDVGTILAAVRRDELLRLHGMG